MFKEKYFSLSLYILVLIILIILLVLSTTTYNTNYNNVNCSECFNRLEEMQNEEFIKLKRDSNELFTENSLLEDITLNSVNDTLIKISSIINESKLIYRFHEYSCQYCIENDFNILKALAGIIDPNRIIVIANFENSRNLKILSINESLPFKCYNYKSILNLPIEKESINNSPCFFILDNKLEINLAYTSNPSHSINSPYFERIEMFFKKDL